MVAKTNSGGTTTWETAYEAFGNQTVSSGTTPLDRQRASTKEQDPTGLLNEGFRYRDPSTGTFLTRDPLGFKAGLIYRSRGCQRCRSSGRGGGDYSLGYSCGSRQSPGSYRGGSGCNRCGSLWGYETGKAIYGATTGQNAATGAPLSSNQRAALAGDLVGGFAGGGVAGKSLGGAGRALGDAAVNKFGWRAGGTAPTVAPGGASPRTTVETKPSISPSAPPAGGAETLYRGTPGNDTPKANLGRQDIAIPRGTALDQASIVQHVKGEDVDAGVTSWTTVRAVAAQRFAGPTGTVIEVPTSQVAKQIVPRPDVGKYSDEHEVLLKGPVKGTPTKP